MKWILKRLPHWQSILGVYATAAFVIYSWTILTSFWKVPSWLYFLSIGEVISIYAYAFVVAFLESLFVLGVLLAPGFVLPNKWWNAQFTSIGMAWTLVAEGSVMLRLYTNRTPDAWDQFLGSMGAWWVYSSLAAIVLSLLISKIAWLRNGMKLFADRLVVFLYIYMPLTAISFLIVIWRNFF